MQYGDLKNLIRRAMDDARRSGRDNLAARRAAVQAVMAVRPDLSPWEAQDAVSGMSDSSHA
ncbi:hypothetical protein [Caenispirillum bisanense]|uniref:hypothetical protein n=1 Tax=Caenispirillum bisanense TaxID=414052 RepID=UPI0031DE1E8D